MRTGIDIGYDSLKLAAAERRVKILSSVGTPETSTFSLNGANQGVIVNTPQGRFAVGEAATRQSRYTNQRRDRGWINSPEYYALFLAGLSELSPATFLKMDVVTGLPFGFWQQDQDQLKEIFTGDHRIERPDRSAQTFRIERVVVVPQPIGALASEALDASGRIVDDDLAGRAGVIVIGGGTTEIFSVDQLSSVDKETRSIPIGGWSVVDSVRRWLANHHPDLEAELTDVDIRRAIRDKTVKKLGQPIDLAPVVEQATGDLVSAVEANARSLWGSAAGKDVIFVAGGGLLLTNGQVGRIYPHTRLAADPVMATALGYLNVAARLR